MRNLDETTKDQLDPDIPLSWQICLHKTSNNRPEHRATNRRKHHTRHRILLSIRLPQIRYHPQCHRTPGRTNPTKRPPNHHRRKIRCKRNRDLPNIDQEQTQLQYRLPTHLLAPRRPELTAKRIEDEEYHGAAASCLLAYGVLLGFKCLLPHWSTGSC